MQTMDRYNHPDGDIMSLLQSIELVQGILNSHWGTDVRDPFRKGRAVSALENAGFKPKTVMQIWQNIAEIGETTAESGLPMMKTVSFQLAECYDWDYQRARLRRGDDPRIRSTMEDEILLHNAGSAWVPELEDTNMFQTDSRDRAADRDAEAYENQKYFRTVSRSWQMTSCFGRTLVS